MSEYPKLNNAEIIKRLRDDGFWDAPDEYWLGCLAADALEAAEASVASLELALFRQFQIENGCLGYPECAGGFHAETCGCAIEARKAVEEAKQ
jgi:hypothetical protein